MMEQIKYIRLDDSSNTGWEAVGELFTQMYSRMDEMGLMLPLASGGAEKWLKTARNTNGRFGQVILAKKGDKAVGFAHGLIKYLPDYLGGHAVGSVTHVYVDDDHTGSGIGKAMVGLLEEWFRSKKVHSMELQVISGNPGAKEFWKKLGYLEELQQYRKSGEQC
jgi:ribosomal protein S18 acetylase RimI-like enzyme